MSWKLFIKPGRPRVCTDLQTPKEKPAPGDLAVGSIPEASDRSAVPITNAAVELPFLPLLLLVPGLQRSPRSRRDWHGRGRRQSGAALGDCQGKLINLSLLRLRGGGGMAWWGEWDGFCFFFSCSRTVRCSPGATAGSLCSRVTWSKTECWKVSYPRIEMASSNALFMLKPRAQPRPAPPRPSPPAKAQGREDPCSTPHPGVFPCGSHYHHLLPV